MATDDTAPRVCRPGDLLWLPPDATVQNSDASAGDVELYGRDLALPNGHLRFRADGEPVLVEASDNIIQALQQRLGTGEGDLVLHPTYGMRMPLVVGVEGTPDRITFNAMESARTCREDPRVARVAQVQSTFADTVDTINLTLVLIGPAQREVPLNLVMPEGGS